MIIDCDKPGTVALKTFDYDRGSMGPGHPNDAGATLLTVNISESSIEPPPALPISLRPIADLGVPAVTGVSCSAKLRRWI